MSGVPPSGLRAGVVIAAWLVLTVALMPFQLAALAASPRLARWIPNRYHRICCRMIGARIERVGEASPARPTLFIVNHVSWVDIMVLSACLEVSFVAKREVRSWPLFGLLARLQRTVFVARDPRQVVRERAQIAGRLAAGDTLVLFAEGTSSPGTAVLPFKTALFAAVQGSDQPLPIQPVSIAYTRLAGMPVGRQWRECFAWYGAMDLLPHFWRVFGLGRFTVRVHFHEVVRAGDFASRKLLAQHCESAVAGGVAEAHSPGAGTPGPARWAA